MYALEVRDHIMIAHSLPGEAFGPAQKMHGATFVVDAAFYAETLGPNDIVLDIGLAMDGLKRILAELNYQNLDGLAAFKTQRSTTEVLCKYIFDKLAEEIASGRLGEDARAVSKIRVLLNESHVARAWYEAAI
ncbi:6-pyruvoyl trahydropterin synthase family protein [Acuticoccus kandeliae]|uniref:6-pyruvoyl trahydropterin synthase family protein n=1 Tax=Acuticoccus kandeliae TaxID=2073160 RepID=UPI000D3E11F4|nr:6-carboxytetrahydropterin synthase [Acuticoccus kandeliae]